jgi:hypothetical protein
MKNFDMGDLFDSIIQEGMQDVYSRLDDSIEDFATQKVFNGKDLLYPTQKAIIKAYNREPLSDIEKELINLWKEDDRTTYKEGRDYQHVVIEGGRRMGKSMILAIICLYELDKLISLDNPAQHFGLLPNSPIALFVIAQSLDQVKNTLFAGIKGFAEQSTYFKSLEKSGVIEMLQTEIRCKSKNIGLYAGHTNSKALVGYSIKLLVLDEVARFEIDENGDSKADYIWKNVGASVNTFGKEGRKIAISSAWQPNDKIEQLWNMCKRDTTMLGFRFRTWDVNLHPSFSESTLKQSSDYIQDPIRASLEYEGVRIENQGAFFNRETVKRAIRGESCIDIQQIEIDKRGGSGSIRYYSGIQINLLDTAPADLVSFAHVDYGIKKDMAAFVVCSPKYSTETEQWIIQVNAIVAWKPYIDTKGRKRIVDFQNCEQVIERVCDARNVRKLTFDSFQSQSSIQNLHSKGIETHEMSTSRTMQASYYALTRKLIDQDRLILPQEGFTSTQAEQDLACIIQKPNGQITHETGYKDIPDGIVNCVWNCHEYLVVSGLMTDTVITLNKVPNIHQSQLSKTYSRQAVLEKLKRIK